MVETKTWKEIQEIKKQREEKYKELVEVKEIKGDWCVICRKHTRILAPFKWDMTYEQIDKKLEEC
jgi:hypothetical protein